MNLKKELFDNWARFTKGFSSLGNETFGMTPEAAAVLFHTYMKLKQDGEKGAYQGLVCGVPEYALPSGKETVDLRSAFSECQTFWEYEKSCSRAKISEKGISYVEKHFNIFNLLLSHDNGTR